VESEGELERINEVAGSLGLKAPIAIRVNPDVDAKTHKFISTGKSKNKFGIGIDRAADVYRIAASLPHLKIRGVQTHIGSQILESGPFSEAAAKLVSLVSDLKAAYDIEFFDFGGGIGIVYDEALGSGSPDWWANAGSRRITPEDYAAAIIPHLKPLGLRILFEPGRFLVGNAGALLATVQYVKQTPAKTFTIIDAAMNDLIRPAMYEAWHGILPVGPAEFAAPVAPADIVGPVCETGDTFARGRALPSMSPGALVALLDAGAYGAAMSSTYNMRPLAAEVLVDGGRFAVTRDRQSYEALLAGNRIPAWLAEGAP
jgi:diaminopimelate decarboxylase